MGDNYEVGRGKKQSFTSKVYCARKAKTIQFILIHLEIAANKELEQERKLMK